MEFIADFHIHSKYSRATSKEMDIEHLTHWAKIKGISLLGTGDFTHYLWLEELKEKLKPKNNGLFEYDGVNFILTAEVSNNFYRNGVSKRIHNIIVAPSFETVDKINKALEPSGSLVSDGRPMLSLDAKELVKIVLKIDQDCLIIPAHAWTPWFSVFGSVGGFDSAEECFEEEVKNIFALETGLSSDPAMNWRLSKLDKFCLISNSDSHSPSRIGREANVFNCKLDYKEIMEVLKTKDNQRFLYTVEFFPQEGKYHFDGHRNCEIRFSPEETKKHNGRCPKCGRPVTVGVMNRVDKLADRKIGFTPPKAIPFKSMIPLEQIIADIRQKAVNTVGVEREYQSIIQKLGNEFDILFKIPNEELLKHLTPQIAKGIIKVRNRKVNILPGYDGEYGKIHIFDKDEKEGEKQLTLF